MTVIAKKIAFAAQAGPARPEPEGVTQAVIADLLRIFAKWLSVDGLARATTHTRWTTFDPTSFSGIIMSAEGEVKDSRIILDLSKSLTVQSSCRLLAIDSESDSASFDALRPFIDQNIRDLGDSLSRMRSLAGLENPRHGWMLGQTETLAEALVGTEFLCIEIDCGDGDGQKATVLLTPNLLIAACSQNDDTAEDAANDRRLSPRLGPCQVNVQAIADRVRMSVADCSRLEIGQIVALPALRFDRLELTVEMGEGPMSLVDAALGADNGRKAVRLNRGLDPSFRVPPSDSSPVPNSNAVPN